jgi:hypothetical protein
MARIHALTLFAAILTGATLLGTSLVGAADVCSCRAPAGKRVELGGTACLPTPTGPRLARCVMDVNILSWQILDTPCVVSFTPLPDGWHRLAGLAAGRAVDPAR